MSLYLLVKFLLLGTRIQKKEYIVDFILPSQFYTFFLHKQAIGVSLGFVAFYET